ncbi:hypothetical protein GCM10009678_13170 [Actinomadura kijaniata]
MFSLLIGDLEGFCVKRGKLVLLGLAFILVVAVMEVAALELGSLELPMPDGPVADPAKQP